MNKYFLILLFIIMPVHALRCGNALIKLGDTPRTVRTYCGKPAHVHRIIRDNKYGKSEKVQWAYDFGPREFIYILTFKHGKLIKIVTKGYGQYFG